MTPERFKLVNRKLELRQPDLTVLMEGVTRPHNFSAILRSCDAVGVYRAHAIPAADGLPLTRTAGQGAEKWVYVERHSNYPAAREALREQGFSLIATHVGDGAVSFREIDLTVPCAIILGTEKTGVSRAALDDADQIITIPMHGMVESLNVSVACALILFEAQRQRLAAGLYQKSRLPVEQFQHSLFEWLHPTIAQYCRERKLRYPALDENGEVIDQIRGSVNNPF